MLRDGHSNWSPGKLSAPQGTREWAEAVRVQLVGMVTHLGEDDESFIGWMELLDAHRAWSVLAKRDGSTFATIEEFCAYDRPWGLGTTWLDLKPFIAAGLARRGKSDSEIRIFLRMQEMPDEPLPKPGNRSSGRGDDGKLKPVPEAKDNSVINGRQGNDLTYTLRRLKRDAPEQFERVVAGEVSANAAAIEAGLRKPTVQVQPTNPDGVARRLVDKLGREFCRDLVIALDAAVNGAGE